MRRMFQRPKRASSISTEIILADLATIKRGFNALNGLLPFLLHLWNLISQNCIMVSTP